MQVHVARAAKHARRRHGVQYREDADLGHQFLQLADVESVAAQVVAYPTHGREAGDDEHGSDEQVGEHRRQNKADQRRRVVVADVTQSRQLVAVHPAHHQHDDRLNGRDGPRRQVEVAAERRDRLATPLLRRRHEPRHREHDPPDGAGHAEKVQQQERDDAPRALNAALDEKLFASRRRRARDGRAAENCSDEISQRIHRVAHSDEDDRSFGISESRRVDEECQHHDERGRHAADSPHQHPDGGERFVLPPEVHIHVAAWRA